ncbi:signal peptidase II [Demequina lutea]|uniref:signal peptidase II n=1 Tax=Demequina lutea TaxID=431489 RepID=UPI000A7DDA9E|nr:signal peptidase II [Demequina lutea]
MRPAVWLAAVLVVALDVFTKQWALSSLTPGVRHHVIDGVISFQLVFNSGAAFSLGENYTWVLTVVAAVVTVGIAYYARRARTWWSVGLFGIALGGALGNLLDRLFRAPGFGRGHVVDMINYHNFFVGNVADMAIVGSAVTFMVMSMLGRKPLMPLPEGPSSSKGKADAFEDASS